tara:strand:+ start:10477 stop:11154 length:678 start_codon:yes stop_codon:yes gene_type:complete
MTSVADGSSPKNGLIREQVCRVLRKEILCCSLSPGAELHEQALAARFASSKSPVRDALLTLEREGLVVVVPRQGYRVSAISVSDAKDMFQLRAILEAGCVSEAIANASDETLAELDTYRQFEADTDPSAFIDYNRRFHIALSRCSGNLRLQQVSCNLIEHMDRVIYISMSTIKGRNPQQLVDEHIAIINAVQQRDVRRARKLAQNHVKRAQKRVLDALERAVVVP